jgi:hypothetical protein
MNLVKFLGGPGALSRYEECVALLRQRETEDLAAAFLLGSAPSGKARLFIIRDGDPAEYAELIREIQNFLATGGMGS